jgi:hypothetical protein
VIRLHGAFPNLFVDDCDELTLFCAPTRAVTARTCEDVSLILQGEALGRMLFDTSRKVNAQANNTQTNVGVGCKRNKEIIGIAG